MVASGTYFTLVGLIPPTQGIPLGVRAKMGLNFIMELFGYRNIHRYTVRAALEIPFEAETKNVIMNFVT